MFPAPSSLSARCTPRTKPPRHPCPYYCAFLTRCTDQEFFRSSAVCKKKEGSDTVNAALRNADASQPSTQPDRAESQPSRHNYNQTDTTQLTAQWTGFGCCRKTDIHHCLFPTSDIVCVTWLSHPSLKCLQPNMESEIVETEKHLCACMHVLLSGLGLKGCCGLKKEVNKTIDR